MKIDNKLLDVITLKIKPRLEILKIGSIVEEET
jgi:hypothetical protein